MFSPLTSMSTRANLVAAAAQFPSGSSALVDGVAYVKNGGTGIADLPGWTPAGNVWDIKAFGAVGSGDETAVFQAAINALPAAGGTIRLSHLNYTVTIGSLNVGVKKVRWVGSGVRVNNVATWALPGIQDSFDTTLGRYLYNEQDGTSGDGSYKDNRRNASYTGGAGGVLNYAERWETTIAATVGSVGNRTAEKAGLFRVNNSSDHANGVAGVFAAFAYAQGAVWGVESTVHSTVIPATYAHRSAEFNIHGYGPDTNNKRWVVETVAHRQEGTGYGGLAANSVYTGFQATPGSADFKYGFVADSVSNGSGTFLNAAFRAYTAAPFVSFINPTSEGSMRFGSEKKVAGPVAALIALSFNTSDAQMEYGSLRFGIQSPTAGAEGGSATVYIPIAGTTREVMKFDAANATNPMSVYVGGALKSVTQGTNDTGGVGFAVLRVANA